MSDEHFTVDGTLIETRASLKSFQRKMAARTAAGAPSAASSGRMDTRASKTDPDARLYRRSHQAESRLAYLGHLLMTQNLTRRGGSAIHGRTTRLANYAQRQHARPRIEPAFGWLKTIAWLRKVKLRGLANVDLALRVRQRGVQPDSIAEAGATILVMRASGLHFAGPHQCTTLARSTGDLIR